MNGKVASAPGDGVSESGPVLGPGPLAGAVEPVRAG
jgi:hypothetical protein